MSNLREMSRPLSSGETIQQGDLFWTCEEDRIIWLEVCEEYIGKEFDASLYVPMRRPITQSMEFICSSEKKTDTSPSTLNTTLTTEIKQAS